MNLFEEIAKRDIKCEVCGGDTIADYGCGWDNDRIYCNDHGCGAEYEFPTTTEAKHDKRMDDYRA